MKPTLQSVGVQEKTYKSCVKLSVNSVQNGFSQWLDEKHLTVIKYY